MRNFINDESGQDLIEYALLASFIGLVVLAGVLPVGQAVLGEFNNIASVFPLGGTPPMP